MSANFSSVQIRTNDRENVKRVIDELSRNNKQKFLVGPAMGDWVAVYPEWCDFTKVCLAIARRLSVELFLLVVKYDDIFLYEYYREGKQVDRYDSCPEYEADPGPREREQLRGQPDRFAHLAVGGDAFAAIKDALANPTDERFIFAGALLEKFAGTLGISNALTCYEYLIEGQDELVDNWSQFDHFPDLQEENARKAKADDAFRSLKRRLISEQLLLAEVGGVIGLDQPWPRCCPASDGRGFFVVSSNHIDSEEQPTPLERYGPPWSAGATTTGLSIDRHAYALALSPSGRHLAVAHAAGDRKATLWDMSSCGKLTDIPQVCGVSWVGFTPDAAAMISIGSDLQEGRIAITPVDGTETTNISLAGVSVGATHPAGEKLVVSNDGPRFVVIDLRTRRLQRDLWIGHNGPPPYDGAQRILFDPAGDRLFLGTTMGVRVYLWEDVLRSKREMPSPIVSFDQPSYTMAIGSSTMTRPGDVHALAYDSESQRLLFAGGDGKVRFIDLKDGRSHLLLEPLEPGPVLALDFSRDQSALAIASRPGLSIAKPRSLLVQFWNYAALCERAQQCDS